MSLSCGRRGATLLALFAAAATGVALVPPTADAAPALVQITVVVRTPDGDPVAGVPFLGWSNTGGVGYDDFFRTNANGVGTFDAIPNSNARLEMSISTGGGFTYNPVGNQVRSVLGRIQTSSSAASTLVIPVAETNLQVPITFPRLQRRKFHVRTEDGLPVADAQVSILLAVSPPLTFGDTAFRVVNDMQTSGRTGTDGDVTITNYESEPDPEAAVAALPEWGDATGDDEPDGLITYYNPKPSASLHKYETYTDWATATDYTVVLPYVPVVTGTTSVPAADAGDASVVAVLRQPDGSGNSTPIAGAQAILWSQPTSQAARTELARGTTDATGRVRFTASLTKATRVVVTLNSKTSVAGSVVAKPRTGLGFGRIQFDAPGRDRSTRASLNKEWFTIVNLSTTRRSLKGWTVRDASGSTYRFGRFTLRPGASVRVHTGAGRNTSTDRYWGLTRHVWGNTRDAATLRSATGARKDRCSWGKAGTGSRAC